MSFDASRFLFDPTRDYLGVVMQQGRVQLDADWNEAFAEFLRRLHAGTLDLTGRSGVPATTPNAFRITAFSDGTNPHITIGAGRFYVDGLLAENRGAATSQLQWDPALAELSGLTSADVDYTLQPYLPGLTLTPAQVAGKQFLVYLDVWQRDVTALQDSHLIDPAVGVDTTARRQTVWQVKLLDVTGLGFTAATPDAQILNRIPLTDPAVTPWATLLQPSGGLLTTGTGGFQTAAATACALSPTTGYSGLENQLYRVEIHQVTPATPAAPASATFKWSRENASVTTLVTAIAANQLTVQSLGRDQVLGFNPGDWIELTDDVLELSGQSGELHRITAIDPHTRTLTLDTPVSSTSFPLTGGLTARARHTRILRWDQAGAVFLSDGTAFGVDLDTAGGSGIPVPPPGTALVLENGITVAFDLAPGSAFDAASSGGFFRPGDFWTFAARTADSSVQALTQSPPQGPYHHLARLATVDFTASPPAVVDLRRPIPALANSALHIASVLVGPSPLANDDIITVQSLIANGINIVCDAPLDPIIAIHPKPPGRLIQPVGAAPVQPNNPICSVSLDLPSALNGGAFTRVTLPCVVTVSAATLQWKPAIPAAALTLLESQIPLSGPAVLARLSLKGSAIWAAANPQVFLNGANNGRPSADFDLWFWLISQPIATLNLNALTFPAQSVGVPSAPQTFTVTNSGATPLVISKVEIAAPFSQTNNVPIPAPGQAPALPPGATGVFSIVFNPTVAGDVKVQVAITESDPNTSPLIVSLAGTGVQPALSVSVASLVFPSNTIVGTTTAPQTIRLTSTGTSQITIADIAFVPLPAGAFFNQFVLSNLPDRPFALQPGGFADFLVAFKPFLTGSLSAQISITHSAPNSPLLIPVSGGAIAGTLALLPASPAQVNFAAILLGNATTSTLTLQNTGNIPLAINGITRSGPQSDAFTFSANPPSLQPGQSATITLTFRPTVAGLSTAQLQIAHAAPGSPLLVNLQGSAFQKNQLKDNRDNPDKVRADNPQQKVGINRFDQVLNRPILAQEVFPVAHEEAIHSPLITLEERPNVGPNPPKPQ